MMIEKMVLTKETTTFIGGNTMTYKFKVIAKKGDYINSEMGLVITKEDLDTIKNIQQSIRGTTMKNTNYPKAQRPIIANRQPSKSVKFKDCISKFSISSTNGMTKDEKFYHLLLVEWFLKWN